MKSLNLSLSRREGYDCRRIGRIGSRKAVKKRGNVKLETRRGIEKRRKREKGTEGRSRRRIENTWNNIFSFFPFWNEIQWK